MKTATPFALNNLSAAAATGALQDQEFLDKTISLVKVEGHIYQGGRKTSPFKRANFVMVDVSPFTGDEAADYFAQNGVLVRSCGAFRP